MHIFYNGKRSAKILADSVIFKKLPKVHNRPIREKSSTLVTLIMLCVPNKELFFVVQAVNTDILYIVSLQATYFKNLRTWALFFFYRISNFVHLILLRGNDDTIFLQQTS
jgi:hypothetical protein